MVVEKQQILYGSDVAAPTSFLLYRRMGGTVHRLEDGYDVFKALHLSAELAYPSRRPL